MKGASSRIRYSVQDSGYTITGIYAGLILNFSENIKNFIDYLKHQKGYSKHTIRNYFIDLTQFEGFLFYQNNDLQGDKKFLKPEQTLILYFQLKAQ